MNRKKTLLSLLILLSAALLSAQSMTNMPPHPRLLLLKGEEKELLRKIGTDSHWKNLHENILAEAGRIIDLVPSERKLEGRRLLGVSRESIRRIFYLSYASRMTGDKKFAERADREMLAIAAFTDWNPSHYLDVAEMTMALSIGYDWLYDKLSATSREVIRQAIVEKGLKTSMDPRYNGWLNAEHNWNQVCNAGITFGALAVYNEWDAAAAEELVKRAVGSIHKPMSEYMPDGAYPEGIGYWSYGTSFNVMFLTALEKIYRTDFGLLEQAPGFLHTGLYSQFMVTPAFYQFNYSDNGSRAGFSPAVFWFYSKTQDSALLYLQKRLLERDTRKGFLNDRLLPAVMIWGAGSGASLSNPPVPQRMSWMGQGPTPVMATRTSWSDSTALYLGFKAGSPRVNHAHMDIGSFIFEAGGVRWAMDFGSEEYNRLETRGVSLWGRAEGTQRWDVFRYRNTSHNTLTINDKPQAVAGYAKIDDFADNSNLVYAMSDLSELYKTQIPAVKRAVSLVDKRYVVIQDLLTTNRQFTKVRWNMLTEADRITFISDHSALLEKGNKKLYLTVESPVPIRFYTKETTPTNTYDSPNTGNQFVGFETDLALNTTQEIRVFLMPGETIPSPRPGYSFK